MNVTVRVSAIFLLFSIILTSTVFAENATLSGDGNLTRVEPMMVKLNVIRDKVYPQELRVYNKLNKDISLSITYNIDSSPLTQNFVYFKNLNVQLTEDNDFKTVQFYVKVPSTAKLGQYTIVYDIGENNFIINLNVKRSFNELLATNKVALWVTTIVLLAMFVSCLYYLIR